MIPCTILYYSDTINYTALQWYHALYCNIVIPCTVLHYSDTLHCTAVQWYLALFCSTVIPCTVLQYSDTLHCTTVQWYNAGIPCSLLLYIAKYHSTAVQLYIALYCNTVQSSENKCITLKSCPLCQVTIIARPHQFTLTLCTWHFASDVMCCVKMANNRH